MPDDRVRINKEVMQTAINDYTTQRGEMVTTIYKMSDLINRQLNGFWDGQASEAFISQFNKMFDNLKRLEDVMGKFIEDLKKVLDTFEANEVSVTDLFERLDTGTAYPSDSVSRL